MRTGSSTGCFFLVVATSMMWACASSQPPVGGITTAVPSGASNLVDVTVNVDATSLPDEKRRVFDSYHGPDQLKNAVLAELLKTGKRPAPGPAEMKITVTGFRLRSTASVVGFGMMAGGDGLEVDVVVLSDSRVLKSYKTGSGSVMGGYSGQGRLDRLIGTTAERIVRDL